MSKPNSDSDSEVDLAVRPPADGAECAADDAGARRGRGRPRVQDVQELEAQLIGAAYRAFTTDGYGATSMAALARAARVSKTTLYAKFPTKAALFRAIIDRQMDLAYTAVQDVSGETRSTLGGSLRHLAERTVGLAMLPANLALNRLIEWEAPRFPELGEAARSRIRIGIDQIASYIREFAEKDQIPCRDPEGAAQIFNFLVRGLYHDLQVAERPPTEAELRKMVERVVGAFLAGRADW
jgi:AcrR family transcriptional regulator